MYELNRKSKINTVKKENTSNIKAFAQQISRLLHKESTPNKFLHKKVNDAQVQTLYSTQFNARIEINPIQLW